MRLTEGHKLAIGLLAVFVSGFYVLLAAAGVVAVIMGDYRPLLPWIRALVPFFVLLLVVQPVLMAVTIAHALMTPQRDMMQVILAFAALVMPFAALPAYVYAFIWCDRPPAWASRLPFT